MPSFYQSLYKTKIETTVLKPHLLKPILKSIVVAESKQNNDSKTKRKTTENYENIVLLQWFNKWNFDLAPCVGHFALFLRPHRVDLYKYAGPTMGHLQHFFGKKTKARQMPGGGDARGWNWLSHYNQDFTVWVSGWFSDIYS